MHKTVVGGLVAATLLALVPLGAAPSVRAAPPVRTVQVVGTAQRLRPYSLVMQMPKHHMVTVYFASTTPLLARFGRSIFSSEIKTGHRLVITGRYQGSRTFFATLIRDTSIS
jgi:hypothetical protein